MFLICPNTESCLVYKNFKQQRKNDRIDIICGDDEEGYACFALDYLKDAPYFRRKIENKEIARRIICARDAKGYLTEGVECSQIKILNGLAKIIN
jgi:hypothetical protein